MSIERIREGNGGMMEIIKIALSNGVEANHLIDGNDVWYAPSENPFGLGCCDCGLFHNVEYRITDGVLELKFVRNEEETGHLRKVILDKPEDFPGNVLKLKAALAASEEKAKELDKTIEEYINVERYHEKQISTLESRLQAERERVKELEEMPIVCPVHREILQEKDSEIFSLKEKLALSEKNKQHTWDGYMEELAENGRLNKRISTLESRLRGVQEVYVVTMYRFGDHERHSYVLGVFNDEEKAQAEATAEQENRGGNKYYAEIISVKVNELKKREIIKAASTPKKGER
jgi:hypothetical protein